jgi:hypothetical protein
MSRPERDTRTYITIHDGMPENPKVECLSDKAFRVWITLLCYSSRNLTDGHIKDLAWRKRVSPRIRAELIDNGNVILHDQGDGVFMHDYLKHQRSALEVAAMREKRRSAGSKGGTHRVANLAKRQANAQASATANAKQVLEDSQANAKQTPSKRLSKIQAVSVSVSVSEPLVQLVSRLTSHDARTTTTTITRDAKTRAPLANLHTEAQAFLQTNDGRWDQIRNPPAAWRAWLDKANQRNKPTLSAKTVPCTEHPDQPAGRCTPCAAAATPDIPTDWRERT